MDRTYVVHHYLDQLPSQPPQARRPLTLSALGLPSSNESHPMDHDSNSSGHAKRQVIIPLAGASASDRDGESVSDMRLGDI